MYSWHYFWGAGQLLLAPRAGGLDIYATHPELQFGPLTMMVSALFGALPWRAAEVGGACMMLGIGAIVMWALKNLNTSAGHGLSKIDALAICAFAVVPAWADLAIHFGHLDDVLALGFIAFGVACASRDRWLLCAVMLGAAAAAKPWALPMGVLLLAIPRGLRLQACVLFVLVATLPWLPFVIADRNTLSLGHFAITNAPDSLLQLLGAGNGHTPSWDRPVQMIVGSILGGVMVARRRWVEVPFIVLAVRMLLDPQTYSYYTSGLVVAAALIDARSGRARPLLALTVLIGLTGASALTGLNGTVAGAVRAGILLCLIISRLVDRDSRSMESNDGPLAYRESSEAGTLHFVSNGLV